MNILICSDSHGLEKELFQLKNMHPNMDFYLHCGDSELEKDHPAIQGFHIVRGNCDYGDDFPLQAVIETGKEKIFITHGHLHHVKTNLMNLRYEAMEHNATIACFGHSHILGYEMIDGMLFINPGSMAFPRGRKERTYIILEVQDEKKIIHVYEFGKGELFQETFH
ncbi:YfcE family phosphodiesterase [Bacillus andreraoultii]|uniref:YfcE family phosphodiesterase n=1 Tax=Bacillus andreraoultii TaxID=1499685 RepID=UPI00053B89FE|nr:metallophosphoesterase [Bacillus andreraoultii]